MAFDYKKEYKEFYFPKEKPNIVDIPKINYLAVRGSGNPNIIDGEYQKSIELLYLVAYTLKMSYKGDYKIEGFFDYVVPPLEGFWWQEALEGKNYDKKDKLKFISSIRLPDFITKKDFAWAIEEVKLKKKTDCSLVEFFTYDEGLCVQCLHIGSYDDEQRTIKLMEEYARENGYKTDITDFRYHHEIYLSDPRKCTMEKLKTVIRYPIKIDKAC